MWEGYFFLVALISKQDHKISRFKKKNTFHLTHNKHGMGSKRKAGTDTSIDAILDEARRVCLKMDDLVITLTIINHTAEESEGE